MRHGTPLGKQGLGDLINLSFGLGIYADAEEMSIRADLRIEGQRADPLVGRVAVSQLFMSSSRFCHNFLLHSAANRAKHNAEKERREDEQNKIDHDSD